MNDSELLDIELAKYCHGSSAENTIIGYGTPLSLGNFATLPNITVNIAMLSNGLITLHAVPITVCLYLTRMSLNAMKKNNSRNFINSYRKSLVVFSVSMIKSNSPSFAGVSILLNFSRNIFL